MVRRCDATGREGPRAIPPSAQDGVDRASRPGRDRGVARPGGFVGPDLRLENWALAVPGTWWVKLSSCVLRS
jgi:hypothetical protein